MAFAGGGMSIIFGMTRSLQIFKSYIKLKKEELINFGKEEIFDKKSPVTNWEMQNTLDC